MFKDLKSVPTRLLCGVMVLFYLLTIGLPMPLKVVAETADVAEEAEATEAAGHDIDDVVLEEDDSIEDDVSEQASTGVQDVADEQVVDEDPDASDEQEGTDESLLTAGFIESTYVDLLPDLRAESAPGNEALEFPVDEFIDSYDTYEFSLDVPETGSYHLNFTYELPGSEIAELKVDILINHLSPYPEASNVALPVAWELTSGERKIDRYGNETYPVSQRIDDTYTHHLTFDMFNLQEPLYFSFEEGTQTITVKNQEIPFHLISLSLVPPSTYQPFEHEWDLGGSYEGSPLLIEEGETPDEKSHAHIRGERTKNIHYHPYDSKETLINVLSGTTWQTPGEWVSYTFDVPQSGYYRVGLRYLQTLKQDMPVFKNIKVNGEYPAESWMSYPVPYTSNRVSTHWLEEDGQEFSIYLEAGANEISFMSTAEPYFEPYHRLLGVIQRMNLLALDIKTITGNKVDIYRDWMIEEFIPDISDQINLLVSDLDQVYEDLVAISGGQEVSQWTNLKITRERIHAYTIDRRNDRGLDRLVNNLDIFAQGDGSMAEQLALALQEMLDQPLDIDQVYLAGDDLSDLPGSPNIIRGLGLNIEKLISSFTYENPNLEIKEDELNIWIQRPVTFIDVLREMLEQDFADSDIKINLSAMPDENRLLMSIIAGEAPDVALGVTTGRPYDFALRGAAYDLRNFSDFSDVSQHFTAEMFLPFAFEDGIYALPETATFFVLFYREDIMRHLGIDIPRTWDELLDILPSLDRQGLNVQTMIATTDAFKHFGTTVPLIQQFDGEVYREDGLGVAFDHPNTIRAFEFLTDLYIRYNLPHRIANFYISFKSGLTPLGVADLGSYVLLKHAAPEINGQWGIAPNFGLINEDGEFISTQPDITSGSIILEQSEKKEAAWEFLKWWMSPDVQLRYGHELQMRFGKEYVWATANLDALERVSYIDHKDREIIVEQVRTAREIPRHPAYFLVERELSNAWNTIVFDGTPVREALDRSALASNRVIEAKLQEFNYLDADGNVIEPLKMVTKEDIEEYGTFVDSSPRQYSEVLASLGELMEDPANQSDEGFFRRYLQSKAPPVSTATIDETEGDES